MNKIVNHIHQSNSTSSQDRIGKLSLLEAKINQIMDVTGTFELLDEWM